MMRRRPEAGLDSAIQCKHLKVWTLWSLVRTDVLQRGIPWTELILRTRYLPNDLNLSWSQRVSAALSFLLVLLGGLEIWQVLTRDVLLPASVGAAGILMSSGRYLLPEPCVLPILGLGERLAFFPDRNLTAHTLLHL